MSKRRRYDDKFRASAVVMLEAQGYPDKKGALAAVSKHLDVPHNTLRNWYHAKHNPPPSEVRHEKKGDLAAMLQAEIEAALGQAPNVRNNASYGGLITAAAIMIDKLQLLTGKATERTEIVSDAKQHVLSRLSSLAATQRSTDGDQPVN